MYDQRRFRAEGEDWYSLVYLYAESQPEEQIHWWTCGYLTVHDFSLDETRSFGQALEAALKDGLKSLAEKMALTWSPSRAAELWNLAEFEKVSALCELGPLEWEIYRTGDVLIRAAG